MPTSRLINSLNTNRITNQDLLCIEQLKFDDRGLIPAIAQDAEDGAILMMA